MYNSGNDLWKLTDKMQGFSSNNVAYGPPGSSRREVEKRNMLVLIIVYLFTFVGLTFVAVSQSTTSWTIIDHYKDFVYPDEYHGLWQTCFDKEQYECNPRASISE